MDRLTEPGSGRPAAGRRCARAPKPAWWPQRRRRMAARQAASAGGTCLWLASCPCDSSICKSKEDMKLAGLSPPGRDRCAVGADLPSKWGGEGEDRTGRRQGDLVLRRGVLLGEGSACLSLGRGTQPVETLATICCIPVHL